MLSKVDIPISISSLYTHNLINHKPYSLSLTQIILVPVTRAHRRINLFVYRYVHWTTGSVQSPTYRMATTGATTSPDCIATINTRWGHVARAYCPGDGYCRHPFTIATAAGFVEEFIGWNALNTVSCYCWGNNKENVDLQYTSGTTYFFCVWTPRTT